VYAGASDRNPVAERGGVRDLELGKAVERVRGVGRGGKFSGQWKFSIAIKSLPAEA
jgi:hypothetical protein